MLQRHLDPDAQLTRREWSDTLGVGFREGGRLALKHRDLPHTLRGAEEVIKREKLPSMAHHLAAPGAHRALWGDWESCHDGLWAADEGRHLVVATTWRGTWMVHREPGDDGPRPYVVRYWYTHRDPDRNGEVPMQRWRSADPVGDIIHGGRRTIKGDGPRRPAHDPGKTQERENQ